MNISDLNISGKPIPELVADKILKWHIRPMEIATEDLDFDVWASQKSGYRSVEWEKMRKRSGNSQHTFKGRGAVDWTCSKFSENKEILLHAIIFETDYTRIAIYNSFLHCDYKITETGQRELFESGADSKWKFKEFIT